MKNALIILALSFVTFSLSGQSTSKKGLFKKKAKTEQTSPSANLDELESNGPDLRKAGKHLKNAGWSFLGSVVLIPLTIGTNLNGGTLLTGNFRARFQPMAAVGSVMATAGLVCNTGAQVIKAGWELMKEKE